MFCFALFCGRHNGKLLDDIGIMSSASVIFGTVLVNAAFARIDETFEAKVVKASSSYTLTIKLDQTN